MACPPADPRSPSRPRAMVVAGLQVGVLLDDLAVAEGVEVAAARFDALALGRCGAQGPLRHAEVADDEMRVIAVVKLGRGVEIRAQAVSHRVLADIAAPPGSGPIMHLEHAVMGKETQDAIEVLAVEGAENRLERLDQGGLAARRRPRALWPQHVDALQVAHDLAQAEWSRFPGRHDWI